MPTTLPSAPLPRRRLLAWLGLAAVAPAAAPALDLPRLTETAHRLGGGGPQALAAVAVLLDAARPLAAVQQVALVNDFVNARLRFASDLETWGVEDFWASPLQALARGQGDCEDYAIAKFFLLGELGLPPAQLRLVYVQARLAPPGQPPQVQAHLVLVWQPDPSADPLVLDNLVRELRPASQRPDLTPVFSFNTTGLWHGVAGPGAGDPLARLSRWRDLLDRARQEGFRHDP